jgi:pseudaminic acid synthase
MKIADCGILKDTPVLIIAELSANHNGSLNTAPMTVRVAKRANAEDIKFHYTANTITMDSKKEDFRLRQGTIGDNGKNPFSYLDIRLNFKSLTVIA